MKRYIYLFLLMGLMSCASAINIADISIEKQVEIASLALDGASQQIDSIEKSGLIESQVEIDIQADILKAQLLLRDYSEPVIGNIDFCLGAGNRLQCAENLLLKLTEITGAHNE